MVPPISDLPIELLSRIFILTVPTKKWSMRRLHRLAQVSRLWRDVVLGTPELWSVVRPHPGPGDDSQRKESLEGALARSGNVALKILYDWEDHPSLSQNNDFMTSAGEHAHRWQSIDYTGAYSLSAKHTLEQPLPRLEVFKVGFALIDPALSDARIEALWGECLRHVHVSNATLRWTSLTGLLTLKIYDINAHSAPTAPRLMDFLTMLRSLPGLEVLYLIKIYDISDASDFAGRCLAGGAVATDEWIDLPVLGDFQINDIPPPLASALISTMRADNLNSLSLRTDHNLADALRLPNSSILLAPAFHKAIALSSCLHIKAYASYLCIESYDADDYLTEEEIAQSAAFELGFIDIPGLESAARCLRFADVLAPIYLYIGYGASESEVSFPIQLLGELLMLKELRLYSRAVDASDILKYLSTPGSVQEGSQTLPCPWLGVLYVDEHVCSWENVLSFLQQRYGPNSQHCAELKGTRRLNRLTLAGYQPSPDDVARITVVDTVTFI